MKRVLIFSIGLVFVVALSLPAMADVDVTAVIDKTKTKTVTETLNKDKDVLIDVEVIVDLTKGAESEAIGNQENIGNFACENCAEKASIIWDSVSFNTGLTNINQAAGNENNQGIAISVSVDVNNENGNGNPNGTEGGFAEAQASVEQLSEDNIGDSENILWRIVSIDNSINENLGITNVNQSSGNMNNQMSAIALAVNLGASVVALSEADLGQTNVDNDVFEVSVEKSDSIQSSINLNHGITNVNQASGNMNNQANVVSFAGIHP